MTEDEYINVMNLAKLRVAAIIVSDLLPMTEREATDRQMALKALDLWVVRLEKAVKARAHAK